MEKLSRGNKFFIIDPSCIKEELNISTDESTNSVNDNINDKKIMKTIRVKLENIDEEDKDLVLPDYHDKNIADTITTKFTNSDLLSEVNINSVEVDEKVPDLKKIFPLDPTKTELIEKNDALDVIQSNNSIAHDDSSFNEEDFILQISDFSDGKIEENGIQTKKTQNKVKNLDSVSEGTDNKRTKLNNVKSKVKKIHKLTTRSYETRGKRKFFANDKIPSKLFISDSKIPSKEIIKKKPKRKYGNDANEVDEDTSKVSETKIQLSKYIVRICLACEKTSECIGQRILMCQSCKQSLKFKCLLCDKYCKTRPGIYSHLHAYHSVNSLYFQGIENEINKCTTLICLKCHVTAKVHDNKIIMCQNCNIDLVMLCLICSEHYKSVAEFYLHIDENHRKHFEDSKRAKKEPHLTCKFFSHKTKYKWNLQKHIESMHQSQINLKSNIESDSSITDDKHLRDDSERKKHLKSCRRELYLEEEDIFKKQGAKVYRAKKNNKPNNTHNVKKGADNKNLYDVKVKLNFSDADIDKYKLLPNEYIPAKTNKKSKFRKSDNTVESNNDDSPFITTPNRMSILNMTNYFCNQCNKSFPNLSPKYDKKCEECSNRLSLKCIKCNREYLKYQSMIYHLQSKCDPQTYFNCSKCNYKTSVSNLIKKHVLRTHGINYKTNTKKCSKCSKRVISLIEHSKFCNKEFDAVRNSFTSTATNVKYSRNHVSTDIDTDDRSTSPEITKRCSKCENTSKKTKYHTGLCEKDNMYHCEICDFKTKCKYSLKPHLQRHKSKVNNASKKDNKIEQVSNNKKILQMMNNIIDPSIDDAMEAICPKCDKTYIPQKYVWKCRKCDTKLTFRCNQCNLKYQKLEALRIHMKSHTDTNVACSQCKKKFALIKNLQLHKNFCKK